MYFICVSLVDYADKILNIEDIKRQWTVAIAPLTLKSLLIVSTCKLWRSIMTIASIYLSEVEISVKLNYWELIRVVDALNHKAIDAERQDCPHMAKEHRQLAHDILVSMTDALPDVSNRIDELAAKLGNE
jgi:hypothetical protein